MKSAGSEIEPGEASPAPGPQADLEQRLSARTRPSGRPVGHQRWNHLLFAHWKVAPGAVQASLPPGLWVDTFAGDAYLGIVPFFMQRVRPAGLPPLPGLSWFLELNVRTYVVDRHGRPGVWFYSLDCNQPVAVRIARQCFHLPYQHARMRAELSSGGTIAYTCQRRGDRGPPPRYVWTPGAASAPCGPGSLAFFLIERYVLFAAAAGRLFEGRVHHSPYQVNVPAVTEFSTSAARLAGFELAGPPASVLAALPVDVRIFALRRHGGTAGVPSD